MGSFISPSTFLWAFGSMLFLTLHSSEYLRAQIPLYDWQYSNPTNYQIFKHTDDMLKNQQKGNSASFQHDTKSSAYSYPSYKEDPDYPVYDNASASYKAGRYAETIELLQKIDVSRCSEFIGLQYNWLMGACLVKLHRPDEAAAYWSHQRNNINACRAMADEYQQMNRAESAYAWLSGCANNHNFTDADRKQLDILHWPALKETMARTEKMAQERKGMEEIEQRKVNEQKKMKETALQRIADDSLAGRWNEHIEHKLDYIRTLTAPNQNVLYSKKRKLAAEVLDVMHRHSNHPDDETRVAKEFGIGIFQTAEGLMKKFHPISFKMMLEERQYWFPASEKERLIELLELEMELRAKKSFYKDQEKYKHISSKNLKSTMSHDHHALKHSLEYLRAVE